jgi:hypothetical protein
VGLKFGSREWNNEYRHIIHWREPQTNLSSAELMSVEGDTFGHNLSPVSSSCGCWVIAEFRIILLATPNYSNKLILAAGLLAIDF